MTDKKRTVVQRAGRHGDLFFTEEALRAQDGKTVPLTLEIGGPVVGEATMYYDEGGQVLMADLQVDDPTARSFIEQDPSFIFKKES